MRMLFLVHIGQKVFNVLEFQPWKFSYTLQSPDQANSVASGAVRNH